MKHFRSLLLASLLVVLAVGASHAQPTTAIQYQWQTQTNKNWNTYQYDTNGVCDSVNTLRDWNAIKDSSHFYGGTRIVQFAYYYRHAVLNSAGKVIGGVKIDSFGTPLGNPDVAISGVTATNGQYLIGKTSSGRFVAATPTAGTGVTITNGAGTSSFSIGQAVATTSTPTFASETLTATTNQLTLGATSHKVIVSSTAPAGSSQTYTIPDVGSAATFQLYGTDSVSNAASDTILVPKFKRAAYLITYNGGAGAYGIHAPTAGTDDGKELWIITLSAQAHVITSNTDGFNAKGSSGTVTFTAAIGNAVLLRAYNGHWFTIVKTGVTVG